MMNINIFDLNQKIRTVAMQVNHAKPSMKSLTLLLITGLLLSGTMPAWAYDAANTVNFNVTGTIEEPVCDVSVKPSNAIDLGTVSYQYLTGKPGATSEATAVSLVFDNCSTGTASVTITFNGTPFDKEDILKGITVKAFNMEYYHCKELLYDYLNKLAIQIKYKIF